MTTENTKTLFDNYLNAQKAVDAAQQALNDALVAMKKELTPTFVHEGQLYQIRVRNGSPYMVQLKETPKEWLANAREKRLEEARNRPVAEDTSANDLEDKVISDTVAEETAMPEVRTVGSDIIIE